MTLNAADIREIKRRRTFAIISHPDAGKTTLTEKFLLYGGAIHEAGEVTARKQRRTTQSDWMKLEQERGISVSSSVMQFDYAGLRMNLLDTPGHADFSEDTYRTLSAADSAIMLLDVAKGVEKQTKKLFDVCRLKRTPIYTFINKLDREGRSAFDLIDEVEKTFNIECNPITWPIGMGPSFRGVYHRFKKKLILFKPEGYASKKLEEVEISDLTDDAVLEYMDEDQRDQLIEEIELIEGTLGDFDRDAFLNADLTPVLFGSARTNFGVSSFLDFFSTSAPPPAERKTEDGIMQPEDERFSAFVFKIQANMDKAHRDRVAFVRVCSGKFERGMQAKTAREEKAFRLAYSQQLFAQSRVKVEEAWAGDIIALHDPGQFRLGDTVYTGNQTIEYAGIPKFSPEHFMKVELAEPLKKKQLQKGVNQLCEEGTIQLFVDPRVGDQDPVLGAVGVLQFEVLLYRLKDEYNVQVRTRPLPFRFARWVKLPEGKELYDIQGSMTFLKDMHGHDVALFTSDFNMDWAKNNNPDVTFQSWSY